MKTLPYLLVLFAACASGDEAAGRTAIGATIAALNSWPQRAALFTEDADGAPDLERPTVTISHEPWGEATVHLPGASMPGTADIPNPRIACRRIRFITSDVALADGDWIMQSEGDKTQTKPLLFVMKRIGGNWKIASVRLLLPR